MEGKCLFNYSKDIFLKTLYPGSNYNVYNSYISHYQVKGNRLGRHFNNGMVEKFPFNLLAAEYVGPAV